MPYIGTKSKGIPIKNLITLNPTATENFEKAVSFLESIGIVVRFSNFDDTTSLPGISIENGTLIINKETLKFPGDILHEAGHIAVVPASDRPTLSDANIDQRKDRAAEEMMAISWSYAVCVHLQLDPAFVFHDEGYKGQARQIIDSFEQGNYLALPMLQWVGMALEKRIESEPEKPVYPIMLRWLRQ
ncbi:MAG: hypothetical protein V4722_07135 [Bacteroidota bacterium]